MTEFEKIYLKSAAEWRHWLTTNHNKTNGIWLIYYKKHTGKPRVPYGEAVEEALCFGWIDSIIKRIDDDIYMQKFTPRKVNSKWSELNKKRVLKMIREGKMNKAGLKLVEIAKQNGNWDNAYTSNLNLELSESILSILKNNNRAYDTYLNLAPSHKKNYNNWIMSAKKEETRLKRVREMIDVLTKGQTLGMK
jgi:uncharacterized protein YdeI (YjbR/CyaY-like superfamily)